MHAKNIIHEGKCLPGTLLVGRHEGLSPQKGRVGWSLISFHCNRLVGNVNIYMDCYSLSDFHKAFTPTVFSDLEIQRVAIQYRKMPNHLKHVFIS